MSSTRICLLGFGEVGQMLAKDLLARGFTALSAWDIQFKDDGSSAARAVIQLPVRRGIDVADAIADADVVISAVTAAQDHAAAESACAYLRRGAFFVDVNSASPSMKSRVAQTIDAAGARYIEAAIMSPIAPRGIASPMLFGGTHAQDFLPTAQTLGFAGASVFSDQVGRASAAKMCRSVMVKGMEALLTESLVSARHYGVEDTVLASLRDMFPGTDWSKVSRYMISRSLIHGRRRAEEMREVARTVEDAGLAAWMSAACAQRQDWASEHKDAASQEELQAMLDRLLASK